MPAILAIIVPLLGAVAKLGEYLVNPIKKQVSYLCCYNSNAQTLIQEAEKLDIARQTVQQQVDAAQRNLEDIRPDVADWLKRSNETKTSSGEVLINADNYIRKGCLSKWCPFLHYSSSREAKKTTDAFVELRNNGKFERVADPTNPANLPAIPVTSGIGFKSRDLIEKEIMDALKDESVYLIGLCGMGGVGKTTMAEQIMYEAKTKTSMFEVVVWATVSRPQDLKKVQQKIADEIGLDLKEENETTRVKKLHKRLESLRSFLIILDDVWEKLDMTKLGIPSQSTTERRKVILTSRVRDVLILTRDAKILTMDVLTEDEAWCLFREKVGESVDAIHLHEIAKEVAKECKGLPLALVVVGSELREKSEHFWKDSLRQLKRSIVPANIPEMLQEVYVPLRWSYDQLQNEEAQNIFLLCCLFPEDYPIDVETLVRYGWGLRIFRGIENLSEARDRVHGLIEKLKLRFLVIDVGDERNERVKMHDVIRDMAISIASKGGHVFMVNDDREEWPIKESYADYTHISVRLVGNFTLTECIDCPRLEFLRMEHYWREMEMPENLFDSTRGLRVLDVGGFHFQSLHSSTFGLTTLRALHLVRCNLEMTFLVGKLENLEILNLSFSNFIELPKEVGQLKKLKLLDLTGCLWLRKITAGVISRLVNLEELLMLDCVLDWEAEEDGKERKKASLTEVASLKKLVTLEIDIKNPKLVSLDTQELERYHLRIGNIDSFYKPKYKKVVVLRSDEESSLRKFCPSMSRNAEYLRLEGDGCIEIINDLVTVPYPEVLSTNLKYLKLWHINNIKGIFSCYISEGNFSELEVLEVMFCDNLRNVLALPMFRGLTSLTMLKLSYCKELEEVIVQEKARVGQKNLEEILFPHLKTLEFSFLPKLQRFCHITNALKFPSLESMRIIACPILESFSLGSNDSDTKFLFNKEALCINLKSLELDSINSTGIFSCGALKENFSKLEVLEVVLCDNLRNILVPPIFRGLTSLTRLKLSNCMELEEVIAEEEAQVGQNNLEEILFPRLKTLDFSFLPKLQRFCHMTNALKLPSLESMRIIHCPMLEPFFLGSSDSDTKFLFNKEVLCTNLKRLDLEKINSIGIFSCGALKENFSKLEVLELVFCDNLRNILVSPMFKGLTSLIRLKLSNCIELEEVIAQEEAQVGHKNLEKILLPRLTKLEFLFLPKLRRFCHMTNALKLPSLESMIIRDCPMLESFSLQSNDSDAKFLFNKEVLCTNLKRLELDCINSTGIFSCGALKENFNKLEVLEVVLCDNLRNILALPMVRGLTSLTRLKLSNCIELEEVIAQEEAQVGHKNLEEILFPHLTKLEFSFLPKFRRFCHMTNAQKLPSLESMIIRDCPMLESFSMGSNNSDTKFLFNKEVLYSNLYELELENVNDAVGLFENRISIGNFSGLEILHVKSCYSLKNLFSPPMSSGLMNLKELWLQDCRELKEVIAIVSLERQRKTKETLFPKLKELMLIKLPKFHRFCHMIEDLELPSLCIITINDCPEMETFSLGSLYLPCLESVYGMKDPILATKFFFNFNKKKCSEEIHTDNSCFKLLVRDLSILRGEVRRSWDMLLIPDSSYGFSLAVEFSGDLRLGVNGKCTTANLSKAGAYEIFYVIMLKEFPYHDWEYPVKLSITPPVGTTQFRTENLEDKPRGQWFEILAGEFIVEPNQIGDIEFSLYREDGYSARGLLMEGVIIRPKSK